MKKTVLILFLCIPLGWGAWNEVRRLGTASPALSASVEGKSVATSKTKAEHKKAEAELENSRKRAQQILDLPEDITRSVVVLKGDPSPSAVGKGKLADELARLGEARERNRVSVEGKQGRSVELEKEITEALARLTGKDGRLRKDSKKEFDTLGRLLDDYAKLEVYDKTTLGEARAKYDWPDLDQKNPRSELDALYEHLDRWTPRKEDELLAIEKVKLHAKAYADYLDDHGNVKNDLVKEAEERSRLWSLAQRLMVQIEDRKRDRQPPTEKSALRVANIAEITTEEAIPERFQQTAIRVARALCADMIPEEKLDEFVILDDAGAPAKVKRKDVTLAGKLGSKNILLGESPFNEFNLKIEDFAGIEMPNGFFPPPIKKDDPMLTPTDYSKAINEYNQVRARKVKHWSSEELTTLRETYNRLKDQFEQGPDPSVRTLPGRIDALIEVARKYPAFFSRD